MRKVLSKKECLFLIELKELLLKYTVSIKTAKKESLCVLVFDQEIPEQVEEPVPIEFSEWLDESDIDELFEENKEIVKGLLKDINDKSYMGV